MQVELQAHIAFHLTGRLPQGAFDVHARSDLRPAIFAGYRDLTALRYDFPLVLVRAADDRQSVQSLSGLINGALKAVAADSDGERVRWDGIRLEREIRKLVAEGVAGPLSKLWDIAAARIGAKTDQPLSDSLSRLRAALTSDGEVVDCDMAMPFRLFQHLWQVEQERKAQKFRADINTLIMKLSDILSAEFVRSKEGLSAERLRASVGAAHQSAFDFDAMSRLLADSTINVPIPESRRRRVRGLLSTLRAQRFYAPASDGEKGINVGEPYSFVFEKCSDAVAAHRERLPKMIELAKAIAVARLEIDERIQRSASRCLLRGIRRQWPRPRRPRSVSGLSDLPARGRSRGGRERPDLAGVRRGHAGKDCGPDRRSARAIADRKRVYDFGTSRQAACQHLDRIWRVLRSAIEQFKSVPAPRTDFPGISFSGPALFSVFSGASGAGIPPYLTAAAAAELRAFPAFTYDPSAGRDWASRFSLYANSQIDLDWPEQRFDYEDEEQQLVSETLAFTLADFAACDPRCAKHFAKVPRAKWTADLVPVSEFLAHEPNDLVEKVPCLLMVDSENRLQKVVVDDKLVREARRCADAWHSLQELGGVHNSHAALLVERERKAWAEQARPATAAGGKSQAARPPERRPLPRRRRPKRQLKDHRTIPI